MSPLLIMLFAAIAPMILIFDPFGSDEDGVDEDTAPDSTGPADAQSQPAAEDPSDIPADAHGIYGEAAVMGSGGNDLLLGTYGFDTIAGGAGNDTLFNGPGGDQHGDDGAADTLDGGAGDDQLYLNSGDTGLGGDGSDIFTIESDATGTVTVEDYDAAKDALVVETTETDVTIFGQTIENGALQVALSNGLNISLPGVENPLDDGSILFVMPNPLRGIA
jgi:Ca2+-binding RTX toxin-like protein